jgi:quercetin 2,3-dioxygenase
MLRTVARTLAGVQTPEGDGMVVRRAFPNTLLGRIDPFLLLDEMGPMDLRPGRDPGFPDHPHRGFETVTYMLDGEFEHRDSHGHAGRLGPGDVQWMTAGAGVVHSEMPSARIRKEGGRIHGLQLWVNLPKADKMIQPRYQEFPAASIPEVEVPGGKVRVIAGAFGGKQAVIDTRTRIQYLHARLGPGGRVALPAPAEQAGFVYAIAGAGAVGGKPVGGGHLAVLADEGDEVELQAGAEGLDAILVTGTPLREPVFQYGPFVMTTREEIVQAVEDFRAGRFGQIPASA